MLSISGLTVCIDSNKRLQSCELTIEAGTIHALIGPNGSGKTTLARTIAGDPSSTVTTGNIYMNGENICSLSANERARRGIFLSFQHGTKIPGLHVADLLNHSRIGSTKKPSREVIQARTAHAMQLLALEESFLARCIHEKLSGGERKKLELLQLFVSRPPLALLDEVDAGLDSETLYRVAAALRQLRDTSCCTMLVISHQERFLQLLDPNHISTIKNGSIVRTKACHRCNDACTIIQPAAMKVACK